MSTITNELFDTVLDFFEKRFNAEECFVLIEDFQGEYLLKFKTETKKDTSCCKINFFVNVPKSLQENKNAIHKIKIFDCNGRLLYTFKPTCTSLYDLYNGSYFSIDFNFNFD